MNHPRPVEAHAQDILMVKNAEISGVNVLTSGRTSIKGFPFHRNQRSEYLFGR